MDTAECTQKAYKTEIFSPLKPTLLVIFQVNRTLGLFEWLDRHFIPQYFPENNYKNTSLYWTDKQFVSDLVSFRVGPARIRQIRVKSGNVAYRFNG